MAEMKTVETNVDMNEVRVSLNEFVRLSEMRMEGFKKISDDLERVIEKDDSNSSTTTESEDGKQMPLTMREKLCHLLHTNKFQIVIVTLVVIDCILVISELLIDLEVIDGGGEGSAAPQVLHYMSIGILSIFMIEIIVKIFAFRLDFFKSKMEVFDAIIVIVSFILDVYFASEEGIESAGGLLIIFRLWRVTRILNGIIMSVKIQAEKRLARERRCREALEQEILKYREYCTAQENEIEALQGLLRKHGISFDRVERPVVGSTIDVIAEVNDLSEKVKMMDQDDFSHPTA